MKKILKNLINRLKNTAARVWAVAFRASSNARFKLAEENGQFVMDNGVVFAIIVALAGVAIGLLVAFLNTDLAPALKTKILGFL